MRRSPQGNGHRGNERDQEETQHDNDENEWKWIMAAMAKPKKDKKENLRKCTRQKDSRVPVARAEPQGKEKRQKAGFSSPEKHSDFKNGMDAFQNW